MILHPKDTTEILIDFSGALTLSATRKEFSRLRRFIASQHQLIGPAATAGAGFPSHISANGSDLPFLFLHDQMASLLAHLHKSVPGHDLADFSTGQKAQLGHLAASPRAWSASTASSA